MALSLNPLDILKILQDKKSRDKAAIADYLDSIATEAANLALVWEKAASEIINGREEWSREIKSLIHNDAWSINQGPYTRLADFYENISTALGRHVPEEKRVNIIFHLGTLLAHRKTTKEHYKESISRSHQSLFFDNSNSPNDFVDLARSVEALHKEAAALHVLAKSFRVLGK